jgi:hypothetical protein
VVKTNCFSPYENPQRCGFFRFATAPKKFWEYGRVFKKMRGEGVEAMSMLERELYWLLEGQNETKKRGMESPVHYSSWLGFLKK